MFKRSNLASGTFVEDYFSIDTLELRINKVLIKDKQGKLLNSVTNYYWPHFGYTPKTFTDADFSYYSQCPTMKFL